MIRPLYEAPGNVRCELTLTAETRAVRFAEAFSAFAAPWLAESQVALSPCHPVALILDM
jgi:hypothetical protein